MSRNEKHERKAKYTEQLIKNIYSIYDAGRDQRLDRHLVYAVGRQSLLTLFQSRLINVHWNEANS